MSRRRSHLTGKGPRTMKVWDSAAHFTDTIRMTIHGEERVNLSGSQQDLMAGQEDSPLSTPILGRRNTSECCTPHSTPSSHHTPHTHHTPHMHAFIHTYIARDVTSTLTHVPGTDKHSTARWNLPHTPFLSEFLRPTSPLVCAPVSTVTSG